MQSLSGQIIKGYEIREPIGSGGFGAVYRAYQPIVERDVAIKVIRAEYANQPDFVRRFETEAQLIARLENPYIVPLYDYWRGPDGAYLVMRWLSSSLRASLKRGAWSPKATARLLDQMSSALAVAHRRGVVHRDIKPDNVLLDEDNNAYLADFGIAIIIGSSETAQEDMVVGSPAYIAPEQIRSGPITPQADIYSLGILLYEMLTGEKPFAESLATSTLILKHLNDPVPSLTFSRPELPEALDEVIQIATAKSAANRYPDVMSLATAFRQALAGNALPEDAALLSSALLGTSADSDSTIVGVQLAVENPYKGLRAFQETDVADFFGREDLVDLLISRMTEEVPGGRFLAVVGPSGSGKSSVVRAGLIPSLRQGLLPGSENWYVVQMTPGAQPLQELEAALLRVAVNPPVSLLDQLIENEQGLAKAVQRILPGKEQGSDYLLLVIDQFEEVFTLLENEAERAHFLKLVLAAVMDPTSALGVIITLRADFYDRPLNYGEFGNLMRARTEIVLPLSPTELERAIVMPPRRIGVVLERDLIDAIVKDVGEQPGALPLLQYALTELFERRQGRALTLEGYRASGGVLGALANRADRLYEELDKPHQEAARQLFLRLVTLGEGVEDTRRRAGRSELVSVIGDQTLLSEVLDAFSAYRLLTFDRDPVTREPTIEVAHEALIRTWQRLRNWLDESREDLRLQRRVLMAANEWINAQRDPSFLASGARLIQFETLIAESSLALNKDERDYIQASVAAREQHIREERARLAREKALERLSRNVLRALVGVLLVATIGASMLASFALSQRQAAQNNAATATNAQGQAIVEAHNADLNAAESQRLALASAAQVALDKGDTDQALALASVANRSANPPALAQRILYDAAYAAGTRRLFTGHTDAVRSVALSPDGKTALSASQDKTLILWDVATGQIVRRFAGHTDNVWNVTFSPDGKTALSASADKTIILWDVASGQLIRRFTGHTSDVRSVAFSPDGKTALSGSSDFSVRLWDIASGQMIRRLDGHTGTVWTVVFSPDGRTALSGSSDKTLILWDVASGRLIRTFGPTHRDAVRAVAFSPDGRNALSASFDSTLILWDVESGQPLILFQGHTGSVLSVAFTPDGSRAISGSVDNTLILWNASTGTALHRYQGHTGSVSSVAISRDGKTALSGSYDQTLRLWDLDSSSAVQTYSGFDEFVIDAAYSPDGKSVLSRSGNGTLLLSDAASGQPIRRFVGYSGQGYGNVAFSPDGRTAISGNYDAAVLWDVKTGLELRRFYSFTGYIDPALSNTFFSRAIFSPDGHSVLLNAPNNSLIQVNGDTGQEIRRLSGYSDAINALAFSPDGHYILAGFGTYSGATNSAVGDTSLRLWDAQSGQELRRFTGHSGPVLSAVFSPDGRSILSGSADGSVRLWDAASGREVRRFIGHDSGVFSVAFSPDGRLALSGAANGSAIVWNVSNGDELRRFDVASVDFTSVAFSPDGQYALLGGYLRLWRLSLDLNDLIRWINANRYVPELNCSEREQFHLESTCAASGVFPTRTPFGALNEATEAATVNAATLPPLAAFTVTSGPSLTPGPGATATAAPVKAQVVQIGKYRGEVPLGGGELWTYNGRKGSLLTIRAQADQPSNQVTSLTEQQEHKLLNTRLIVRGPDGSLVAFSDDVKNGTLSDSAVENLLLPLDGAYTIEVRASPDGAPGGAYSLTLEVGQLVTAAPSDTPSATATSSITPTLTPVGATEAATDVATEKATDVVEVTVVP